jgi:hypothetical protein
MLIKNNENGKYIGYLTNNNSTPLQFNSMFTLFANTYTSKDKNLIINNCEIEAQRHFDRKGKGKIRIIDLTI